MTFVERGLWRSRRNRLIGGVCGGIAQWLGWPPMNVRAVYILVSVLSMAFPGTIVYLVLWVLMPLEPRDGSL